MSVNVNVNVPDEAAQLVIGAALLDQQFMRLLLQDPAAALMQVEGLPGAPAHLHLTAHDHETLAAVRMPSLEAFAHAVERRRRVVWSAPTNTPMNVPANHRTSGRQALPEPIAQQAVG